MSIWERRSPSESARRVRPASHDHQGPMVTSVLCEVDRYYSTTTELALNRVPVREGRA
jgi:hypothetical protein